MDNQRDREVTKEQKLEEDFIEAERRSVVALKDTFAHIKSVEFEKSRYNKMTDFYSMIVIGGKVVMDTQKGKNEVNEENVKMHIAEEEIALYLVRNYIDVKKSGFHKFNEIRGVGYTSWSIPVDVKEDNTTNRMQDMVVAPINIRYLC